MSMTGYTGMFYDYGKGYPFPEYDIELIDNFTKVAGRHTFKFGADETGYKNYIKQGGPALSHRSATAGNAQRSTARGPATRAGRTRPVRRAIRSPISCWGRRPPRNFAGPLTEIVTYSRDWEFYAQDTFQVTSRLTLNYGLRYMYQSPWRVRDNRVSYPRPEEQQAGASAGFRYVDHSAACHRLA